MKQIHMHASFISLILYFGYIYCAYVYTFHKIDHEYSNVMREEHQNVMMIATMQRRHEHELAAVRKDVAVLEERCDKLEEEKYDETLQKIDVESSLENLQREMEILQQKCKYYTCDDMNTSCYSALSNFI